MEGLGGQHQQIQQQRHQILQRQHLGRCLPDALLQQRAESSAEQSTQCKCHAETGQPGQHQTLVHHQHQTTQCQQQARQARGGEAALGQQQRQDGLHAQQRGQQPRRHAVRHGLEVADRIEADHQQAGAGHLPAGAGLGQPLPAWHANDQQHPQRHGEAQDQQGKDGAMVQAPAGENGRAAPEQHEGGHGGRRRPSGRL